MARAIGLMGVVLVVPALFTGCMNVSVLTMTSRKPAIDQSVVAPKVAEKKFKKVMVIPPSGTARGAFEPQIVLFEREFLKRNVTVISGAITGKVVLESAAGSDEKKSEAAALLSDLERALIMAKRTGAEAILQVGEFDWSKHEKPTRFFLAGAPGMPFREVKQEEYTAYTGEKRSFYSYELRFVGRLVDVENGEVMATFEVALPMNYVLSADYIASYIHDVMSGWQPTPIRENFPYSSHSVSSERKAVERRVIEIVVEHLAGK